MALPGSTAVSFNQTVASLAGTGGVITNSDATNTRTLIVKQSASTSYSGAITGNLTLDFVGFSPSPFGYGQLTLSGANTYTGGTTIDNGTLVLPAAGALPSGSNVGNNGRLVVHPHTTPRHRARG